MEELEVACVFAHAGEMMCRRGDVEPWTRGDERVEACSAIPDQ